jgi:uncharacterized protein YkwD
VLVSGVAVYVTTAQGTQLPDWNEVSPSLQLDETETERLVYEKINDERGERNLTIMASGDALTAVARNHSQDMAERGYFNHTTPDGVEPAMRVERAGIQCDSVGENIIKLGRNNHEEPLAEDAVAAWLDSPGHLMNIVDTDWTRTGVGLFATEDTVYITQVFCASP